MKDLKQFEGRVIRMYSFEDINKYLIADAKHYNLKQILFSGTKTELLSKGEEFWKPLVDELRYYLPEIEGYRIGYLNYSEQAGTKDVEFTAKESGHSAIEDEKEFIIICSENI